MYALQSNTLNMISTLWCVRDDYIHCTVLEWIEISVRISVVLENALCYSISATMGTTMK